MVKCEPLRELLTDVPGHHVLIPEGEFSLVEAINLLLILPSHGLEQFDRKTTTWYGIASDLRLFGSCSFV